MFFRIVLLRILPKKKIQIGKTSHELEGIPEEYFQTAEKTRVVAKNTQDCEYPVLERDLMPTRTVCPVCKETTLVGLDYCDKCGVKLSKEEE